MTIAKLFALHANVKTTRNQWQRKRLRAEPRPVKLAPCQVYWAYVL